MHTTSLHLVLITGMSGSGKSVALTALEDVGFYCVDNLPPELLEPFIALEQSHRAEKVAIAMDVRSAASLPGLPQRLAALQKHPGRQVNLTILFLDANTDTLTVDWSLIDRSMGTYDSNGVGGVALTGSLATGYSGIYFGDDWRYYNRVDFSGIERFDIKSADRDDGIRTGDGDDTVSSAGGNDHINTGKGIDIVDGGADADTILVQGNDIGQTITVDLLVGGDLTV